MQGLAWDRITARHVARNRVDLPPIFGPVNSIVDGRRPSSSSSSSPPRSISLGTWPPSKLPTAYGCHRHLIESLRPSFLRWGVVGGFAGRKTGLLMHPVDERAVDAKDWITSTQLSAWMTSDHSPVFATNSWMRTDSVSPSNSFTSWSCQCRRPLRKLNWKP